MTLLYLIEKSYMFSLFRQVVCCRTSNYASSNDDAVKHGLCHALPSSVASWLVVNNGCCSELLYHTKWVNVFTPYAFYCHTSVSVYQSTNKYEHRSTIVECFMCKTILHFDAVNILQGLVSIKNSYSGGSRILRR